MRAEARDDTRAAVTLLERAVDLLPEGNPERIEYLMSIVQDRMDLGDAPGAKVGIDQAMAEAEASRDPSLIWRARLTKLRLEMLEPDPDWPDRASRVAREAIDDLQRIGDDMGLARAWQLLGGASGAMGRSGDWADASERVVECARRAGQSQLEQSGLCWLSSAVEYGPMPVPEALGRCERLLEEAQASTTKLWILRSIAMLVARQGEIERARSMLAEAEAALRERGAAYDLSLQGAYEGWLGLLANDLALAASGFERAIVDKARVGDHRALPEAIATLAEVRYRQGRYDDASRLAEQARRSDLLEPYSSVISRSVEAKISARQGRFAEAITQANRAAEIAGTTDLIELQGDVQLDLAEVLRLAGRAAESAACLNAALELYERKGNAVMVSRARSLLAEIGIGSG